MNKTTFKGEVNGKQFDSQQEMIKYLSQCVANNKPLTSISYSTETKFYDDTTDEKEQKCCCHNDREEDYECLEDYLWDLTIDQDPIEYIIPKVNEDTLGNDTEYNEALVENVSNILKDKMHWIEENIFQGFKQHKFDPEDVQSFYDDLTNSLVVKQNWCAARLKSLRDLLEMTNDINDRYNLNKKLINTKQVQGLINVYDEVGGFCAALIDIISENNNKKN